MVQQIISDFLELVQIDAASGNERGVADVVKQKLLQLGCEVIEDDAGNKINGNAGNIIARLPGVTTQEALLFSAHMDRVADGYGIKPQISNGLITSNGDTILAADNIAGVVSIIDGIRQVIEKGKEHCPVEIFLTVSEEKGLLGSFHADLNQFTAKIAFVLDSPGRFGRITNTAPTKERVDITVNGKSAHAGNEPEKGINAIMVAAAALSNLHDGRINECTTANIGIISGGKATNVVCDTVILTGEIRSAEEKYIDEFKAHLESTFISAASNFHAPQPHIDWVRYYDGFNVPVDDKACQYAAKALREMGVEPRFVEGGGGMDANRLNKAGIKAIGISTGYEKNHTFLEQLHIEDLLKASELVARLITIE